MINYNVDWLKDKVDRGDAIKYIFFWGHTNKTSDEIGKFVFSQWFYSPFTIEDITYKTAEHWMMAHKAKLFGDSELFHRIIAADKPGEVKKLGRQISNFDEVKWNRDKYAIVKAGNRHKFGQNKKLNDFLISTGDRILVEASPVDSIWGIGLPPDSNLVNNPHTWNGLNLLGFALMETRDFLKSH